MPSIIIFMLINRYAEAPALKPLGWSATENSQINALSWQRQEDIAMGPNGKIRFC
jgi:hypothetical protein